MTRKSLSVISSLVLGLGLGFCLLVSSASAQTGLQTPLYEGEIVGTQVNVRSGPSTNYYAVARLGAGTRVKAYEEKFGWLAITPPDGVFSYVSKEFVTLSPDGKIGTITGDNVLVRAGSMLNDQKTTIHSKLQRGDKVSVLGESAGFLKILPPDDARVYVSADFVAKVGSDGTPIGRGGPRPALTTQAVGSQPADAGTGVAAAGHGRSAEGEAVPAATPAVAVPSGDELGQQQTKMADVENRMALILRRPVLEQTFEDVEPVYKELSTSGDLEISLRSKARLVQIGKIQENQKLLAEMRNINSEADKIRAMSKEERDKERQKALEQVLKPRAEYVAQGKLDTSSVYADLPGPKRYRLRDPATGQTLAYVEVADETKFDVRRLLGAVVGIIGRKDFDARNNVYVVYPDEITLLAEVEKPTVFKPESKEPSNTQGSTPLEAPQATQPAN